LGEFLVGPCAAEVGLIGVKGDLELIAEAEDSRHIEESLEADSELSLFELAERIAAQPGTVRHLFGGAAKKHAPRNQLLANCARSPLCLHRGSLNGHDFMLQV
jgi:hypothetical protein